MWPKLQLLTAAAVIGICCLLAAETTTATSTATTSAGLLPSTSSLPLPLQPPTGPQNVTITTSSAAAQAKTEEEAETSLSDSAKELNKQAASVEIEALDDLHYGSEVEQESETATVTAEQFVGVPGFLPTILPIQEASTQPPTNGHGYIQFQIGDELPMETARRQSPSKTATVNEVLSNLFPHGFSDIFRFSYPADSSSSTEAATELATQPATEPASSSTTETIATTTSKAVVLPTPVHEIISTTTPAPSLSKNQTYYSYQTTVTKEYRRELRPGHTQIVVEKIARGPHVAGGSGDRFNDGSNHISKDELLRINRAAVAAPVLPSLLLRPEQSDDNETLVAAESAPIIILGEHETELDESQSLEDNLIAESQHLGQQLYHHRLPPPAQGPHDIESYRQQQGPGQEQQINVHIVHDETVGKAQESAAAAPPAPQPAHALDHYQAHSEQRFQQRHQANEAPSRQFLKTFKPVVSGSADGPIPKGVFHYEVNNPPPRLNSRPPSESDYAGPYIRPAAQLAYQRELSHVLQQPQQPQSPQPTRELSQLHTDAIASPPPPPHFDYQGYGGHTPSAPATPNSLVFVTLNTPAPPPPHSSPTPQLPVEQPLPNLNPHEYVSEAAAEPSQQHAQHAPPPPPPPSPPSAPPQPVISPNGYTFVEVQKSVNIHNKLITEKDGRLVEQHETIYHQPYQFNQLPVADYSPKDFVSHAAPAAPHAPHTPAKNYVSLATNPINVQHVEYDSSPQEGAISHATINIDTEHHAAPSHSHTHSHTHSHDHSHSPGPVAIVEKLVPQPYAVPVEKIVDRPVHVQKYIDRPYPVKQIVEKHIAVPYPVHVEHYVDRPYPVQTFIEQPVPYPVETVVEKIVEKHVPVEVERIVEKPVEKIVEKFVDRPMAVPIHVPVGIRMPMPPGHNHAFSFAPHPNALPPWSQTAVAHVPPKVLQNYYTRMLKKLLPQLTAAKQASTHTSSSKSPLQSQTKPPRSPLAGEAPKVATFSLADMRFDLRPPPPPQGSPWLQGARYIYNTLPADLSAAASAAAPSQMVKSYIGPVPAPAANAASNGESADEFQRWRNGHSLKRSPDFGRNLHMEYGFKPPLVPSMEIDDKGNPLKLAEAEPQ